MPDSAIRRLPHPSFQWTLHESDVLEVDADGMNPPGTRVMDPTRSMKPSVPNVAASCQPAMGSAGADAVASAVGSIMGEAVDSVLLEEGSVAGDVPGSPSPSRAFRRVTARAAMTAEAPTVAIVATIGRRRPGAGDISVGGEDGSFPWVIR